MSTIPPIGLAAVEAAERLRRYDPNELSKPQRHNFLAMVWEVAREPMVVLLLLACGTIYLTVGDLREALILLGSVVLVIGITLLQERKTKRALEALRDLSSPRANVIRDGKLIRIAGRDVVPGDVLLLEEGDRIPADAVVVAASDLRVDESLLTGESLPVTKQIDAKIYASTLVVRGRGHGHVQAN